MKVINIVDNATKVNFGIWNAAIATSEILRRDHQIESELWYPNLDEHMIPDNLPSCGLNSLKSSMVERIVGQRNLNPANTVIATHGCWRFPTRWGYQFKQLGFRWIYVPHGMLEPWSLSQKKWQKKIYFAIKEKKLAQYADVIRAVGAPELENLQRLFPNHPSVELIPNGVPKHQPNLRLKDKEVKLVLYMSRLHHKKGVTELVKAWLESPLNLDEGYKLIIAGPDQGELKPIEALLGQYPDCNVKYIGPVYGEEKVFWLNRASFYILPSKSEGFPTAILEAMSFGLVPIITEGCNFPDVFEHQLGIKVTSSVEGIMHGLRTVKFLNGEKITNLQLKAASYINEHYSLDEIARLQANNIKAVLKTPSLIEEF